MDALYNTSNLVTIANDKGESVQSRLRKQMQADSLQPVDDEEPTTNANILISAEEHYDPEVLEEATQFLRLQVRIISLKLNNSLTHFFRQGSRPTSPRTLLSP